MNKKIAVILSALLCLSVLTPFASAADSPAVYSKSFTVMKEGQDLVLKNVTVVPETGFIIVTEEMDKQDAGVMRADPDRNTSKTFKHVIYDTNYVVMATCYSTVTGTYSQADGWAQIDSVTAYFVGDAASHFSYTPSKSGAYGYLNVKYDGESLSTFTYHIATNGLLSNR